MDTINTQKNKYGAYAPIRDRSPNDWYVEESWAVEAFARRAKPLGYLEGKILDPCAGLMTIPSVLRRMGVPNVAGCDIEPRSPLYKPMSYRESLLHYSPDAVVTNPPFRQSVEIINASLQYAHTVCVFEKLSFLASRQRHPFFTEQKKLHKVYVMSDRVSCLPGHLIPTQKPGGGAIDYAWLVFKQEDTSSPTIEFILKE